MLGLLAAVPLVVAAQDRAHFEQATARMCLQQQRQLPVNAARPDASLATYCGCYAREMATTVSSDVLNTSRSAATPEQTKALQAWMEQAGRKCAQGLHNEQDGR